MRKFSSYGQIDTDHHYYAPRKELITRAYTQLRGENPEKGGHYITVWAPRQTGKSWLMLQVAKGLKATQEFEVAIITMEFAKDEVTPESVLRIFSRQLGRKLEQNLPVQPTTKHVPVV